MELKSNIEWFAIQTKAGLEDLASHNLASLGMETFLPLARGGHFKKRRHEHSVRPLFPCYCFARFDPTIHLHSIRYSRGVLRVVGTEETPWPLEDSIIEDIRLHMNGDGVVDLQQTEFIPGQRVRICDGPLEGWTGIFDSEMDDRLRVAILLEAIKQARVLVKRESLELAEAI